jgi:hypothetical protein
MTVRSLTSSKVRLRCSCSAPPRLDVSHCALLARRLLSLGPVQHAEGGNCWLDAVLGLSLALTPLAAWATHATQLPSG